MVDQFKTKHNLPFLTCEYHNPILGKTPFYRFKIGTCTGLWGAEDNFYIILAIDNDKPGNGHFEDVLQWFERSCKRDNKGLKFASILNPKFGRHLVHKRGFKIVGKDAIKIYNKKGNINE